MSVNAFYKKRKRPARRSGQDENHRRKGSDYLVKLLFFSLYASSAAKRAFATTSFSCGKQ